MTRPDYSQARLKRCCNHHSLRAPFAFFTFIKLFVLLQLAIAAFIIKVFKFQHPFRYQLPVVVEFELPNWPFLALIVNDVEPFVIKAKPIVVTLG